jgi:hypothetical protein
MKHIVARCNVPHLSAPRLTIGEEEDLAFREIESRQHQVCLLVVSFLPRLPGSRETASVSNVLAKSELAIDR